MAEKTGRTGKNNAPPDLPTPQSGPVTCVALTGPAVESAARLYTEVFLADEPTTRHHAPDPAFFLPHAQEYVGSLARKNLSFLARDTKTEELTGFIFCFDLTEDPADEGESMVIFIAHFREAVAMINELEDRHLDRSAIRPGSVLHIFQIGVSHEFRGRGVAKAMIRHVLAEARVQGFRQVVADCTGPASKKAFEACGFSQKGFLSYDAFTMDGVRFFDGLDGGISLMARDI
jgi:ribosomal protein S18 acetylase RimI-like enzyme